MRHPVGGLPEGCGRGAKGTTSSSSGVGLAGWAVWGFRSEDQGAVAYPLVRAARNVVQAWTLDTLMCGGLRRCRGAKEVAVLHCRVLGTAAVPRGCCGAKW